MMTQTNKLLKMIVSESSPLFFYEISFFIVSVSLIMYSLVQQDRITTLPIELMAQIFSSTLDGWFQSENEKRWSDSLHELNRCRKVCGKVITFAASLHAKFDISVVAWHHSRSIAGWFPELGNFPITKEIHWMCYVETSFRRHSFFFDDKRGAAFVSSWWLQFKRILWRNGFSTGYYFWKFFDCTSAFETKHISWHGFRWNHTTLSMYQ